MEVAIIPPSPPPLEPSAFKLERKLPDHHRLKPTWDRFCRILQGEEFGFAEKELQQFGEEFAVCVDTVTALNNGERVEDMGEFQFEKSILRAHDLQHTIEVTERTLQMLPGFLNKLKADGVDVQTRLGRIKALVLASVFHDIGYLKRKVGDEVYLSQLELFFDHVDRGVEFAPQILDKLGIDLSEHRQFCIRMIKATDFNDPWIETGRDKEEYQWGNITRNADLLAYFGHTDNIPSIVAGLYWEHQGRAIKGGKVKKWERDEQGCLVFDENGKPVFADIDGDEDDYALVLEAKFASQDQKAGSFTVKTPTLYQFVASPFLPAMQQPMEPYLGFADLWYGGRKSNLVRKNYDVNCARIVLLKEATKIAETDPLSIFEGAFTGHDLQAWTYELKAQGLIPGDFMLSGKTWYEVDQRVLAVAKADTPLERLVTAEIKEILKMVSADKSKALQLLLERFREKMSGEKVADVYLAIAPKAYVDADGTSAFADLDEAVTTFHDAVIALPVDPKVPNLHLVYTVRRDKDFPAGREGKEQQEKAALAINKYRQDGLIGGVSFLGVADRDLEDYKTFFDQLKADVPLIVLAGQTFGGQFKERATLGERLRKDIDYLSTLSQKFPQLAVWGLQDIEFLAPEEQLRVKDKLSLIKMILTWTFDQMSGLVVESKDEKEHPFRQFINGRQNGTLSFATGNSALATGSCSVTLDTLAYLIQKDISVDRLEMELVNRLGNNQSIF